ncbi:MAG: hypothetical protein SH850_00220 [Planctomycetaceae bacterium]|nr:hypothetical protein [Planctomycetaceae bacterium]
MTLSRPQCSPRRPFLTVAGIVSAGLLVWFSTAGDAAASCGDYLLAPHQIAKHQTLPAEFTASGVQSNHSDRPCRGPYCQRAPRPEPPQPAPVTIVVSEHWACPIAAAWCVIPAVEPWTPHGAILGVRAEPFRLERPPRG